MSTRVRDSAQVCRAAAMSGLAAALLIVVGCSGSEGTPSSVATSPTPTPGSSTSPPFSVAMSATGGDCYATRNDPISCHFEAAPAGGQGPFSYTWTFSAGGETVTMQGQTVTPTLGCRFSGSAAQFTIDITLRADQAAGPSATARNDQRIYRVAGDC